MSKPATLDDVLVAINMAASQAHVDASAIFSVIDLDIVDHTNACSNCKFFILEDAATGNGRCVRHAPPWPKTIFTNYCGDHRLLSV